ncbi:MAG: CPBP family intramembrane metalloprotease, partial [Microbacteriaceae bacterium]|nr:CPBP family intramembrane metalloprotease [Microbacteriaceae bacterium]
TGGMLLAQRPTGIIMALVVVVIALIVQSIPAAMQMLIEIGVARSQGVAPNIGTVGTLDGAAAVITLLSFGLATLWIWFWMAKKEHRRFSTLGFTKPRAGLITAGRGALIGVGMLAICVLVPVIFGQAQLAWAAPDASSWGMIVIMLIGFMVQGSTEEILTRGYLTQAVARRWGLVAAVIIQALFFMLIHGANPGMGVLPIINLIAFAIFGTFLSLAEGGLWGICAMHGAWNWAQGNLFGVAVSGNPLSDTAFTFTAHEGSADLLTGGAFGIEGSLVTTVVFAGAAVICWRIWRKSATAAAANTQAAPITQASTEQALSTEP